MSVYEHQTQSIGQIKYKVTQAYLGAMISNELHHRRRHLASVAKMSQPTDKSPVLDSNSSSDSGSENLDDPVIVTEEGDVEMVSPPPGAEEAGSRDAGGGGGAAAVATQSGRSKQQRIGRGRAGGGRFGGQGIEEQMGGGSAAGGHNVTVVDQGVYLSSIFSFVLTLRRFVIWADYWKGATALGPTSC